MKTEFQTIPLSEIHESPHNPRKHFDAAALNELAESIKTVGILTPLLVRPSAGANGRGTTYEIAAGHRRYRASKLAGLDQAPCLVRPLTDQQFMEILTIENLQREDVHPLDEAKGYEALMAAPYKMPVERIAERVGRSVKYVYDRVKLLGLSKEAQQLFWDGKIEAGHAILLARLTHDEQKRVIGNQEEALNFVSGGLFQRDHGLFRDDVEDALYNEGKWPLKAVSVRELDKYIKEHIRFHAHAPDSFLFPDTAEKLAEARLARIKVIEITREYLADDDVRKDGGGKVYGERSWKRADGQAGSKTCDRSVLGVVSCGPGQGEAFNVCINKEKCQIHWGAEMKAREKRQTERQKAQAAGPEAVAKQKAKEAAEDAKRERERKERTMVLHRVIQQLAGKLKSPLPKQDLVMLAADYVFHADFDQDFRGHLGLKDTYCSIDMCAAAAAKQKDPLAWLFLAFVIQQMGWDGDDKKVRSIAERYKVDVKGIEKAVKAELNAKDKQPASVEAKPATKAKGKKLKRVA